MDRDDPGGRELIRWPTARTPTEDRAACCAAIGVASVDELFADIPAVAAGRPASISRRPQPEAELAARLRGLAGRNRVDLASFLGAGAYRHFTPAVVDQLLLRGEFYTAYTPYQPEISQGTLQTIYEYQSLMAELTGLDVVSASHYDGATATAEAALMTCRATRRERVLVSRGVHPHYRQTLVHLLRRGALVADEIPLVADGPAAGTTDLAALERLLADPDRPVAGRRGRPTRASSACSSRWPRSAAWPTPPARCSSPSSSRSRSPCWRRPASTAPTSPPARASRWASRSPYGGPVPRHPGLPRAAGPPDPRPPRRHDHRRRRPARLRDDAARARAGHPAREGRQQHLHQPGPLRPGRGHLPRPRSGRTACATWPRWAPPGPRSWSAALAAAGAPRLHAGPYLNEFAVRVPDAAAVHARLLDRGDPGRAAAGRGSIPDDPPLADGLLVCATEVTTAEEIAAFRRGAARELAGAGQLAGGRSR